MNKHEFFNNEMAELARLRRDDELVARYTWLCECSAFRDAVDCMIAIDKDATDEEHTVVHLFLDCDEFDARMAVIIAERGTESLHRKHRKSRRMAKVSRRKDSRWVYYLDGTAKECKRKNHKAVRREYDIPVGKSNFSHKVGCYEYFW
jgi:hypothetical protein